MYLAGRNIKPGKNSGGAKTKASPKRKAKVTKPSEKKPKSKAKVTKKAKGTKPSGKASASDGKAEA